MAKRTKHRSTGSAIAVQAPHGQSESVSIRQIKNGYIIERSGVKRGKYHSEQEYSPGRPVVVSAAPPPPAKAARAAPKAETRPRREHREVGYLRQTD